MKDPEDQTKYAKAQAPNNKHEYIQKSSNKRGEKYPLKILGLLEYAYGLLSLRCELQMNKINLA